MSIKVDTIEANTVNGSVEFKSPISFNELNSSSYYTQNLPVSLQTPTHYYNFNETSGNILDSGNALTNYDLTIDGGIRTAIGFDGRAIEFIGSNPSNASNSSFSFSSSDPTFVVSGWFKRTGDISAAGPWGFGGVSFGSGISAYTGGTEINYISIDFWGITTYRADVIYPLNEWVHVIWVKTGTGNFEEVNVGLRIYVNGERRTLTRVRYTSSTPNVSNGLSLGKANINNTTYNAPIIIDEFKVFDGITTFSDNDAVALFESSFKFIINGPVLLKEGALFL